ncbi:MAG: hypothetical protein AB1454_03035 [Candidatus Auribacterota bacterium]
MCESPFIRVLLIIFCATDLFTILMFRFRTVSYRLSARWGTRILSVSLYLTLYYIVPSVFFSFLLAVCFPIIMGAECAIPPGVIIRYVPHCVVVSLYAMVPALLLSLVPLLRRIFIRNPFISDSILAVSAFRILLHLASFATTPSYLLAKEYADYIPPLYVVVPAFLVITSCLQYGYACSERFSLLNSRTRRFLRKKVLPLCILFIPLFVHITFSRHALLEYNMSKKSLRLSSSFLFFRALATHRAVYNNCTAELGRLFFRACGKDTALRNSCSPVPPHISKR